MVFVNQRSLKTGGYHLVSMSYHFRGFSIDFPWIFHRFPHRNHGFLGLLRRWPRSWSPRWLPWPNASSPPGGSWALLDRCISMYYDFKIWWFISTFHIYGDIMTTIWWICHRKKMVTYSEMWWFIQNCGDLYSYLWWNTVKDGEIWWTI